MDSVYSGAAFQTESAVDSESATTPGESRILTNSTRRSLTNDDASWGFRQQLATGVRHDDRVRQKVIAFAGP